ncbi:MAG: transcriptional regulator [Oleiphilus sp.]|nr:MAG: transcriptional regulator [Oleiphilus sp.]
MDASKNLPSTDRDYPNSPVHESLVEAFKNVYQTMNRDSLDRALLAGIYDEQMHFEDSFHVIDGLDEFYRYCDSLYENVRSIDFRFHEQWVQEGQGMLTWTMQYEHPKLNRGKPIYVDGASHIRFQDRVYFHKDYFDGGQLLYEQVPLLGSAIRLLKGRMG